MWVLFHISNSAYVNEIREMIMHKHIWMNTKYMLQNIRSCLLNFFHLMHK